jgi:hypothetical protein
MKQRQVKLEEILTEQYCSGNSIGSSIKANDLERMGLSNEVRRIYEKLGGILLNVPLTFGGWDIILDGLVVELDEEQHFNRYRAMTLNSFIYHMEKGLNLIDYSRYCKENEEHCLRKSSWGNYWSNPSTEKQFGLPGVFGDLEGNGSPRWKQRAYYDYLRDVFAILYQIRLIRISIYDRLVQNGRIRTVGELLDENNPENRSEILKFMNLKIKNS